MTEDEYVLIVEHAQRAIAGDAKAAYAVANFDMIHMLAAYREHEREIERKRSALTQIENWVGKEYRDLAEAESIREFIDKACEEGLGQMP